jgi:hypothetical protein
MEPFGLIPYRNKNSLGSAKVMKIRRKYILSVVFLKPAN